MTNFTALSGVDAANNTGAWKSLHVQKKHYVREVTRFIHPSELLCSLFKEEG